MRAAVKKRGWAVCVMCEVLHLPDRIEIDHAVPLIDGGTDEPGNVYPMCRPCHREKTTASMLPWPSPRKAALGEDLRG